MPAFLPHVLYARLKVNWGPRSLRLAGNRTMIRLSLSREMHERVGDMRFGTDLSYLNINKCYVPNIQCFCETLRGPPTE